MNTIPTTLKRCLTGPAPTVTYVSVIIPTYNAARWIVETVRSVQQQTYPHLEILIIDDGSTDDTVQVIKTLEDSRLQLYCLEHAGVSSARNHGIKQATGEFIAFLDAEDLWREDMLAEHVAALQKNPAADVAYCWTTFMDEVGRHLGRLPAHHYTGNVYHKLVRNNFLTCGSLVARCQAIARAGYFDSEVSYGEDLDYWLRLAIHSHFVLVPQYQFFYRRWSGSTSANLYTNEEKIAAYRKNLLVRKEKQIQMHQEYTEWWMSLFYMQSVHLELKLYLHKNDDYQHIRSAMRIMGEFLSAQPRRLAQKATIKMLGKLVLIALLPRTVVIRIMGWYRYAKYRHSHSAQKEIEQINS